MSFSIMLSKFYYETIQNTVNSKGKIKLGISVATESMHMLFHKTDDIR